jgi:hypothetical protein
MHSSAKIELFPRVAEFPAEAPATFHDHDQDPSRAARGIIVACGLSLLIWIAIAFILI